MLNWLKKIKKEHDDLDIYNYEDYYSYENIEDLLKILYDKETPEGVYVYEKDDKEVLLKIFDKEGRIRIGLLGELTSLMHNYYVATSDGLVIKDDSAVISSSSVEQFMVLADAHGYEEFILIDSTYDRHINVVNWYGKKSEFTEK